MGEDFDEYRRLILDRLDRQDTALATLNKTCTGMREDILLLKFKSGVWGSIAGAVVSLLAIFAAYLKAR